MPMGKPVTLLRSRNGNRSGSNGSRNGSNGSRKGRNGNRNGRHAAGAGQVPQQETKNYITPQGYARLKSELSRLLDVDRAPGPYHHRTHRFLAAVYPFGGQSVGASDDDSQLPDDPLLVRPNRW